MALALILARLLLRGSCPSVPRSLPPVLCGGGAGPGFTRACSPRHITTYYLETGPWAMLSRSLSYHPMGCHGWWFVYFKNTKNLFIHIALIPEGDNPRVNPNI